MNSHARLDEGAAMDPIAFRNALGTFTTGVTIITTRSEEGEAVGVTANSFSSVSLDPPLILWSLAKTAASVPVFGSAEYFAVHILAADQQELSNRFATRGEDKFGNVEVQPGRKDIPLLSGCCARMQCRTAHRYDGGDHIIFVGEVVDLEQSDAPPLVFQAGNYALASRKGDETPLLSSSDNAEFDFNDDYLGYLLWRAYFQFHRMTRKQEVIAEHTDPEFLTLVSLFHSSSSSMEDLSHAMSYDGDIEAVQETIQSLAVRELVEVAGSDRYVLTEKGREVSLNILSAAKATETEFLNKIGSWESMALKNLLRQFIVETNPGLPHLWESQSEEQQSTNDKGDTAYV